MLIEVIIPTLAGRERYLTFAIRSCLSAGDCLVLVSSNGGASSVRQAVNAIGDSRVRLVETARVLHMAEHWEFALLHAIGDVISIIGDDDAIVPGAVHKVTEAFCRHPGLQCLTHRPAHYYWPDYPVPDYANRCSAPACDGSECIMDTKKTLKSVIRFKEWYGRLPYLYHGFVNRAVLDRIRATDGAVFKRIAPDIYSDFVLALNMDWHLSINECLSLGGQGAKSNGANLLLNTELGRDFLKDLPEILRPELSGKSINLQIFEYADMIRRRAFPGTRLDMAWYRFAIRTVVESARVPAYRKEILDDLARVVSMGCDEALPRMIIAGLIVLARSRLLSDAIRLAAHYRESLMISRWHDAALDFGADNALDVATHIGTLAQRAAR